MLSKLLISFLFLLQSNIIIVDKIAAVVEGEIITLTDIDKAILFFPVFQKKEESEKDFYIRILQDLINYKVISLEYKGDFNPIDDDFEDVQTQIINKIGSLDKLLSLFGKFNMEWNDFKDFIKEKVLYEIVLKRKFQLKIIVGFKEIEKFYNEEYLPVQKKLKLEPKTLIEMTELIEKHLQKIKIEEQLSDWLKEIRSSYKIENKLT